MLNFQWFRNSRRPQHILNIMGDLLYFGVESYCSEKIRQTLLFAPITWDWVHVNGFCIQSLLILTDIPIKYILFSSFLHYTKLVSAKESHEVLLLCELCFTLFIFMLEYCILWNYNKRVSKGIKRHAYIWCAQITLADSDRR